MNEQKEKENKKKKEKGTTEKEKEKKSVSRTVKHTTEKNDMGKKEDRGERRKE